MEPAQLPLLHLLHLCRGAGGALPLLTSALHHGLPEVARGTEGLVAEVEGRGVRVLTGQRVTAVEQVIQQRTAHHNSSPTGDMLLVRQSLLPRVVEGCA